MRTSFPLTRPLCAAMFTLWGCSGTPSTSGGVGGVGGSTASPGNSGGAPLGGANTTSTNVNSGGSNAGTGGKGVNAATGGKGVGGATPGTSGQGGSTVVNTSGACTMGTWPAADPSVSGPFATVTEENVGPQAGAGVDGGTPPQFTLFRPKDLAQGGLCHPIVTWGNGTGSTPSIYKVLLNALASHGFVVIASNSLNVGTGTPAPMVVGVTWVIEQNSDPTSPLYQKIDTAHVGATGHSQGGFATTSAGADAHITAIAPICGASTQRNLHGPALLLCGGQDTTVPCDGMIQTAFNGITNQPVMLADFLAANHASWLSFRAGTLSPVETAVVAWMRVHLLGDTALRPRFYGATCTLCQDAAWKISQKMMDQ